MHQISGYKTPCPPETSSTMNGYRTVTDFNLMLTQQNEINYKLIIRIGAIRKFHWHHFDASIHKMLVLVESFVQANHSVYFVLLEIGY